MSNNNIYYDITPEYPKQINKKMHKLYEIDLYDTLYNIPCYKDNCNGKFVYMLDLPEHDKKFHTRKCCVIL
jgi:hypothetical protein